MSEPESAAPKAIPVAEICLTLPVIISVLESFNPANTPIKFDDMALKLLKLADRFLCGRQLQMFEATDEELEAGKALAQALKDKCGEDGCPC